MISSLSITELMQNVAVAFPSAMAIVVVLLKVTGFLLIALLATMALQRKSAGTRHLIWLVALGALLLVPPLAVWSPLQLPVLPSAAAPSPAGAVELKRDGAIINAPVQGAELGGVELPGTPPSAPTTSGPSLGVILLGVWAAVAAALLLRLVYGAWSVRRIVRRGQLLEHPDWQTPLYEIADRLELDAAPTLLRSEDVKMPFAAGLLHSTIVLPAESDGWSAERRTAVLIHELGHIRRRDLVGHTLGRIACALYWFHPLVWTAARRLRAESERACDDLALVFGAKPSDYAEHLLEIVTCVRDHYTPAVALAMAHRKEFEGRMLAILNPELIRRGPGRMETASLAGGLALMALVIGAAAPVARSTTTLERVESPQLVARDSAQQASLPAAPVSDKRLPRPEPVANARPVADPPPAATPQPTPRPEPSASPSPRSLIAVGQDSVNDDRADALARALRTDTDPAIRRVAAWGLSRYANTEVGSQALIQALAGDSDAEVREMAVWALADGHRRPGAAAAIARAMREDKDAKVRATAVWAAGEVGDEIALEPLIATLGDANPKLRETAAWAIGSIEPSKAPAALVSLLKDSDRGVRMTAAWALYTISDETSSEALEAAFQKESDPEVREGMIRALGSMGDRAVPTLQRLITSSDPKVRQVAITALAGGTSGPWPQPRPRPRPFP